MEYFVDENGMYVFKGGGGYNIQRRIITVVIVASGLIVLGISVFMYTMMKRHGGLEHNPILPFMPVLTFPVTLVILLFVRKRLSDAGRVTVDYMNGRMIFGRQVGNRYSKVDVGTSKIRRILLSRDAPGGSASLWSVSVLTPAGQQQVMIDRDETRARGFAGELAALVSSPMDDLTRH